MTAYRTVAQIVGRASVLLGLEPTAIAAPYSSTKAHILQLLELLASAGEDLLKEHAWPQLQTEHDFSTSAGEDTYDMPEAFDRHLDQTQWNRSTTLPLTGPLTPQEWQRVKASGMSAGTEYYFRATGAQLVLYPEPASTQTLALEYLSRYWVQSNASPSRDKAAPTADNDILWLDGQMLVHRLRRDFQDAKGFDSTAASNAYEAAFTAAKNAPPTPVVNLNRRARTVPAVNLPATGWGT